jgi:hypothetical protein
LRAEQGRKFTALDRGSSEVTPAMPIMLDLLQLTTNTWLQYYLIGKQINPEASPATSRMDNDLWKCSHSHTEQNLGHLLDQPLSASYR